VATLVENVSLCVAELSEKSCSKLSRGITALQRQREREEQRRLKRERAMEKRKKKTKNKSLSIFQIMGKKLLSLYRLQCKGDIVVVGIKQHKSQFNNSNFTITQSAKFF